jgi:hypothetical protein
MTSIEENSVREYVCEAPTGCGVHLRLAVPPQADTKLKCPRCGEPLQPAVDYGFRVTYLTERLVFCQSE